MIIRTKHHTLHVVYRPTGTGIQLRRGDVVVNTFYGPTTPENLVREALTMAENLEAEYDKLERALLAAADVRGLLDG